MAFTSSLVLKRLLYICHHVQPRNPLVLLRGCERCSRDYWAAGIDSLHPDRTVYQHLVYLEIGRSVVEGLTTATRTSNLVDIQRIMSSQSISLSQSSTEAITIILLTRSTPESANLHQDSWSQVIPESGSSSGSPLKSNCLLLHTTAPTTFVKIHLHFFQLS